MNTANVLGSCLRLLCLSIGAMLFLPMPASGAPRVAHAATCAEAVAALEGPDPEFKTAFTKQMAKKDKAEMAKLVKAQLKDAVEWIVYTGEQISEQSSDELETFMTDLREAWKTAEKTDFADKVYKYFSTVTGANKKDRLELKKRYLKAYDEMQGNLQKKDSFVFQNIVDEFELLGGAFDQVGDFYDSSEAWLACAACYDEPLRGQSADLYKACSAYMHALEARDHLELKDPAYEEATRRKAALVSKGFDKRKKDAGAAVPQEPQAPSAPTGPSGNTITVPMSFEVVGSLDLFQRPAYDNDEIYVNWIPLQLKAKGSTATLSTLAGFPPLCRVASNDLRFDTNGDNVGDEKVNVTGNVTAAKIMIGKGDEQRPWALLCVFATDKESYQGMQVNFAPDDKQMAVYTMSAASIVGTVGATPVRIIDETMDGIYGSPVELRGAFGLSKDNYQPALDSIVIGNSKHARPWSEYQEIEGKWYKLDVAQGGKELKATPVNVDTGILKLDYKGPTPTWLVVHGEGELKNSYFDLVEGGAKGIAVPVGKYALSSGDVRKGKKKQTQKALIVPGKSTPTWTVTKGQTTVVTLGAPYGFDFKVGVSGEKATIEGQSVVITGSQGERYERTWNCVPKPEVEWRQKGSKQNKRPSPSRMGGNPDDALVNKVGWGVTWSPLDFEFKVIGDKIEVQLSEKKHDLFGKIESAWKE